MQVERYGFAYRAGLRPGDKIIKINKLNAEYLTLMEAQEFIRHSGKSIKFVVHGYVECNVFKKLSLTIDKFQRGHRRR